MKRAGRREEIPPSPRGSLWPSTQSVFSAHLVAGLGSWRRKQENASVHLPTSPVNPHGDVRWMEGGAQPRRTTTTSEDIVFASLTAGQRD